MRIISQKGLPVETDMPYEKVAVSQSMKEPNKIIAWDVAAGENNIILMAEYSAQEKAEKTMQMLHDNYAYNWKLEHGLQTYYGDEPIVFRFPNEDEL